ncbi:MAG: methyltransferase domain-containing protein [Burkholderiaceae bacterium]
MSPSPIPRSDAEPTRGDAHPPAAGADTRIDAQAGHHRLVDQQFGPRAAAYVASAVHAQGEDLTELAALARSRPGSRILDLGCGGGHVAYHVAEHAGEVVAYDLSPSMLAAVENEARRRGLANVRIEQGSCERLPFDAQAFDLVLCRFSAHHWQDLKAGLREARRVLRPDGQAVFIDIVAPESAIADSWLQTFELLRDPSHGRDYRVSEWQATARECGFEPGTPTFRRLRMAFASWVERMWTPAEHVAAIRALQRLAPAAVREHFGIEDDGSFTIDSMSLPMRRAA